MQTSGLTPGEKSSVLFGHDADGRTTGRHELAPGAAGVRLEVANRARRAGPAGWALEPRVADAVRGGGAADRRRRVRRARRAPDVRDREEGVGGTRRALGRDRDVFAPPALVGRVQHIMRPEQALGPDRAVQRPRLDAQRGVQLDAEEGASLDLGAPRHQPEPREHMGLWEDAEDKVVPGDGGRRVAEGRVVAVVDVAVAPLLVAAVPRSAGWVGITLQAAREIRRRVVARVDLERRHRERLVLHLAHQHGLDLGLLAWDARTRAVVDSHAVHGPQVGPVQPGWHAQTGGSVPLVKTTAFSAHCSQARAPATAL
eukprot:2227249-Rhodomonas_salina.1